MPQAIKLFLLPISLTIFFSSFIGEHWRHVLRYQRDLLENHELWRLLTSHLLHHGWNHLFLNLLALILIIQIFKERSPSRWWLESLICALGVSLGIYFLNPEVFRYVGFSGLTHGLLAAAIIDKLHIQPKIYGALLAGLSAKLFWEQIAGPLPLAEESMRGSILVDAHLYGALSGFLLALTIKIHQNKVL